MANEYMWMYLIIFLFPLARIVPRLVRKYRGKNQIPDQQFFQNSPNEKKSQTVQENTRNNQAQTKDMRVMDQLHQGVTNFERIQRNTGIESKELEGVLGDLEKRGLMKVVRKQGLLGPKVELHAVKDFR